MESRTTDTFQQNITAPSPLATGIAADGNENVDVVTRFSSDYVPGSVSLPYGFPSSSECPIPNGGTAIRRMDVNGLAYVSTANESARQRGSINTFDPILVVAVGGYAKGAMLDWWDGEDGCIKKVISLVSDNTVDFRKNGPDGVYWQDCSTSLSCLPDIAPAKRQIVASFDSIALPNTIAFVSDLMEMPFDGYISCFTNLTITPPTVKIPYCTSLERFSGVTDSRDNNFTQEECGNPATVENVDLAAFSAFAECWHKLFLGVGDDLSGISLSDNPITASTGCGVFMISSSGLEGSAAQVMIPVKKGNKMRLFGKQTYTENHKTVYAKYEENIGISYINGTKVSSEGTLVSNPQYAQGKFHLSCVIAAYPTKEIERI